MGFSMGMGPESGMYGSYGMSGAMTPGPRVDFALVRFFDMGVETDHKYRYRIAVFLEDANHPRYPNMEPNERNLDDTVKTRLADVLKSEKEKNNRVYYVRTDWSQPSAVVHVSPEPISLAGTVETFRPVAIPNSTQSIASSEPKGTMMSVVWDEKHAVDAPAAADTYRGTVLNFKAKADVIHPVTLQYRELDNFDFLTDRCVVDIRGGEELPGSDKEPLAALGEYLVLTRTGELLVKDELDDYDEFQLHKPPVLPAAPAMGPESGMMGPGSEGMMPMPGEGGRRGRRRGGAEGGP
jgi:hypothetical protein